MDPGALVLDRVDKVRGGGRQRRARLLRRRGQADERKQRAQRMLEAVGLGDRIHHMPAEMSGGQRQRVAIARSLINDPSIIMADEPTGNLDSKSTKEVMEIFSNLYQSGKTVILVTHELGVANYAERHVILSDGHISKDIRGKLE
ncbi:ABC transporter ATP-binding protein [Dialister invisus]|uniref:ABC transporter ATP-binding protein n=1 Tax=Dialister invisus TaxID=218538 RepID=UPI003AB37393